MTEGRSGSVFQRTAGGLLVVAAAVLGLWPLWPPAPLGEAAPAERFSADRAMAHVRAVAREPHMIGSEPNARVRRYIIAELEQLGLEVRTQERLVVYDHPGREETRPRIAWPINILARLPGESDAPAIALMTHYDSVPTAPGAGDAGSGVATLLETARALTAQAAPLTRDVLLVFTDGEEIGLMGAQAFLGEHPWAQEIGLLLNFEARGAAGPAYMFQTGPGNAALIGAFGDIAPYPAANSISGEVYRRMPNDTDATIALDAGIPLLNFAFIDDFHRYHAPTDAPQHLSARSLQHEGDNALALTGALARASSLPQADTDATYFNLGRSLLVHYRRPAVYAAGGAAIAIGIAALVVGRRRQRFTDAGLAWAALATGAGILAAFGLIHGLYQWLAEPERPYALLYRHQSILIAFVVLTVALLAGLWNERSEVRRWTAFAGAAVIALLTLASSTVGTWGLAACAALVVYGVFSARCRPEAIAAVTVAAWILLTLGAVMTLPHASYLLSWPLLVGAGVTLWRWQRESESALPAALALFTPVFMWSLMIHAAYLALGVQLSGMVAAMVVLVVGWGSPWIAATVGRKTLACLWLAGAVILGWAGFGDPYDADHPRPSELFYALDIDEGQAWWATGDPSAPSWAADRLTAEGGVDATRWFPDRGGRWRAGPAPLLDIAPSRIGDARAARTDNGFQVRFRLLPSPATDRLEMFLPAADYTRATIAGRETPLPRPGADPWRWTLYGPPEAAIEVVVEGRGEAPASIRLTDIDYGWPQPVATRAPPRPPDTMAPPWSFSDSVLITRRLPLVPTAD